LTEGVLLAVGLERELVVAPAADEGLIGRIVEAVPERTPVGLVDLSWPANASFRRALPFAVSGI